MARISYDNPEDLNDPELREALAGTTAGLSPDAVKKITEKMDA